MGRSLGTAETTAEVQAAHSVPHSFISLRVLGYNSHHLWGCWSLMNSSQVSQEVFQPSQGASLTSLCWAALTLQSSREGQQPEQQHCV